MSTDDIDFKQAMAGVKPLRHGRQTASSTPKKVTSPVRETTDLKAPTLTGISENEPGAANLYFARGGFQGRPMRELKQSRHFHSQAILDLHGLNLRQAEAALLNFIDAARSRRTRYVLIIHGKGLHTPGGQSSLKAFTANWLKQQPGILAYVSAHNQDGGNGALYVLLKKPV